MGQAFFTETPALLDFGLLAVADRWPDAFRRRRGEVAFLLAARGGLPAGGRRREEAQRGLAAVQWRSTGGGSAERIHNELAGSIGQGAPPWVTRRKSLLVEARLSAPLSSDARATELIGRETPRHRQAHAAPLPQNPLPPAVAS